MQRALSPDSDYEVLVIDCRYNFEHEGGHILGALNINRPSLLDYLVKRYPLALFDRRVIRQLRKLSGSKITLADLKNIIEGYSAFSQDTFQSEVSDGSKVYCKPVLVFHCEFSQKRAPKMWSFLRNLDRELNVSHYPKLQLPEIYLLRGGFNLFVSMYPEFCSCEQGYISEMDERYSEEAHQQRVSLSKEFELFSGKKKRAGKNHYASNILVQS